MDIFSCGSQVPRPIEATLKPGEVLYLPPYWFHCVVTVTPSISINVWSDSSTYKLMEEVYNAPIPFEEQWDEQTLMQGIEHSSFFRHLVSYFRYYIQQELDTSYSVSEVNSLDVSCSKITMSVPPFGQKMHSFRNLFSNVH